MANPAKKKRNVRASSGAKARNHKGSRKAAKRSKNGGLAVIRPVKGEAVMKKSNPGRKANGGRKANRKKKNPATHRSRRRRNSSFSLRNTTSIFQMGFWVLVGLVLTRQLPQALLGAKNTGVTGYIANLVTALVSAWAAGSVGGEKAALGAGAGGGAYTITRVLQEKFNPIGKYVALQGLGDGMALGELLSGDRTYFPLPVAYDNARNPIIPAQIRAPLPSPLPLAAANAGMGAYGRRRVAI